MAKNRLDLMLYDRGLVPSREKAKAVVLAGKVFVNGVRVDKPGTRVLPEDDLVVRDGGIPYVSRGGLKLVGAIKAFNISFTGKSLLDVGASTGGFTDCALKHGARRVIALDVGYGQLDWRLRNDERVTVKEKTNIRFVTLAELGEPVDIATIDVSFISLALVLPVVARLIQPGGEILALVKPQFEAGRDKVGKKGVVRDAAVHAEVLQRVIAAAVAAELSVAGITYSPLKGPEGNIEYFVYMINDGMKEIRSSQSIEDAVTEGHQQLGGSS